MNDFALDPWEIRLCRLAREWIANQLQALPHLNRPEAVRSDVSFGVRPGLDLLAQMSTSIPWDVRVLPKEGRDS